MNRKYFITLIAIILMLQIVCIVFAQGPKFITQQLFDTDNVSHPDPLLSGEVTFKAWIVSRSNYILDETATGSYVGTDAGNTRFLITFNIGNLPGVTGAPVDWSAGEIVRLEISQISQNLFAFAEFPIEAGNSPQLRYRTDVTDLSLSFKISPEILFNSNNYGDYLVTTNAALVDGYTPDGNGVYRAVNWMEEGRYWQAEINTEGFEDIYLTSRLRRQFVGGTPANRRYGPKYFTTQYSLNGQEWVPTGNPNEDDGFFWWELPDSDEWVTMSFELPEDCDNKEQVWIRWLHLEDWFDVVNNAFGEIKDVIVFGHPGTVSPNPTFAGIPIPENEMDGVAIDLGLLSWTYKTNILYTDPVGFRIYFNETGEFGADDDYEWVDYVEEQEEYFSSDILPEELNYAATYYWKVIPTTDDPNERTEDDRRRRFGSERGNERLTDRGDAVNCPVWSFTTEFNPDYVVFNSNDQEEYYITTNAALVDGYSPDGNGVYRTVNWMEEGRYWQAEINTEGFEDIYLTSRLRRQFVGGPPPTRRYGPKYFTTQYSLNGQEWVPTGNPNEDDGFFWWELPDSDEWVTMSFELPEDCHNKEQVWIRWLHLEDWFYIENNAFGEIKDVIVFGYPGTVSPNPTFAGIPIPENEMDGVAIDLGLLSWTYIANILYTDPVGFRVYFNETGEFGADDEYEWVDYIEEQEEYFASEILPEELNYAATYYWKVIPTTDDPIERAEEDRRRRFRAERGNERLTDRGDAVNCPVWSFTTELNPVPVIAEAPYPVDDSVGVSINLEYLSWTFTVNPEHVNPLGFRVYFNETGIFGAEDDYEWVPYVDNQTGYNSSNFLSEPLNILTTYCWNVIPTTTYEDTEGYDAEDTPVWSFTTGIYSDPVAAINPDPANNSVDISIDIEFVSWSYYADSLFANPVGFRVYFNESGEFGAEDEYEWVDYVEEQEEYFSSDILPEELNYAATYYWKVIPTTDEPDERAEDGRRRRSRTERGNERLTDRGDAENCPVWSFTTEQNPVPVIAVSPNPADESVDVSIDIEDLSWSFTVNPEHVNPVGFRVYFNETGEFGAEDEYEWVDYIEEQEEYFASEILPEEMNYAATYYWKVIPTTSFGEIEGNDTADCPIWSFTTEEDPSLNPTIAVNPTPAHEATGVSIDLEYLQWSYISNENFTDPVGFKVFFGESQNLGEDFEWIDYDLEEENYSLAIPVELTYLTTYFWQVIPTTDVPDERTDGGRRRRFGSERGSELSSNRGDAVNCPVWSFTVEDEPVPIFAVNPTPTNNAVNIPVGLQVLSWEYHQDDGYINPIGFKVFFNTIDIFSEDTFGWVDYDEEQEAFSLTLSEIWSEELVYFTDYYWKVIPTTTPYQRESGRIKRSVTGQRDRSLTERADALNCPVWTFRTHFGEGSGTEAYPWQIATAQQLNNLRYFLGEEHSNKYFMLTEDIDLGVPPYNEGSGWEAIGNTVGNSFRGTFNGNGKVIKNLYINRGSSDNQGFFGRTRNAFIYSLGLVDVDINARNFVGGLIGVIDQFTRVERSFVTGNISGYSVIGGITGQIAGDNPSSYIENCYSIATIITKSPESDHSAGGIVGWRVSGVIRRNYAVGSIYSQVESSYVGAVIGRSEGGTDNISYNYWNKETTLQLAAGSNVGIIIGNKTIDFIKQNTFTGFNFAHVWSIDENNSYPYLMWQGDVPDIHNYPPLLPPQELSSYPSNESISLSWTAPDDNFGIPVGYNVYRDNIKVNNDAVDDLVYEDTNGLSNLETYRYQVSALYNDGESMLSSTVYATPVAFAGGDGSVDFPFQVSTVDELFSIRYLLNDHYLQIADIDLDGSPYDNWMPIGTDNKRFTGSYDGAGFTIANLKISSTANAGLFGYLEDAVLENIGLIGVNIDGIGIKSGSLAGSVATSEIRNCYAIGKVQASYGYTGGLIGYITGGTEVIDCWNEVEFITYGTRGGGLIGVAENSTIENCSGLGSVTSLGTEIHLEIGGLVGYNNLATIINSYSISPVTASINGQIVGGLVGRNSGTITNCYAAGRIIAGNISVGGLIGINTGLVQFSYWDTETSGYNDSDGGSGRTALQMKYPYDLNTFENWDFDNTWIDDDTYIINNGYPYLYYQTNINPTVASNPAPGDQESNIPIDIGRLSWSFAGAEDFVNPVGFKVYLNTNGDFDINSNFKWVPFENEAEGNFDTDIPSELAYATTYYWKVIPTTIDPYRGDNNDRRRLLHNTRDSENNDIRGDALNCPIWSFTTENSPNPMAAKNPSPANNEIEVSILIGSLSWEYDEDDDYVNPEGFRVYFNTTGQFGAEDDFEWVYYVENQSSYATVTTIIPDELEYVTTYYWKVIPSTDIDERGDAQNCPVWQFRTQIGAGSGTLQDPWQISTADQLNGIRQYTGTVHSDKYFVQTSDIDLDIPPYNQTQGWIPIGTNTGRFAANYNGHSYLIKNLMINRISNYQGLFGYIEDAILENISLEKMKVTGSNYAGGIAGRSHNSVIIDSYAKGEVNGLSFIGGLAGFITYTQIEKSYSTGKIKGIGATTYIGGITGYMGNNSTVSKSYSTMTVIGNQRYIGGLIGALMSGIVDESYAAGSVSSTNPASDIGGLIGGRSTGVVNNCFWNLETSGQIFSVAGEGKTTDEMIDEYTFDGWDFVAEWRIDENTYPRHYRDIEPLFHNKPVPYLTLSVDQNGDSYQVALSWQLIGEQPSGYHIYRNDNQIDAVNYSTQLFIDENVDESSKYTYYVKAVYDGSLISERSNMETVIIYPSFAGGDGSSEYPYEVATATQLNNIRFLPDRHFIQTQDIDLSGFLFWEPIGDAFNPFRGTYDGTNYIITGLNISRPNINNQALFAITKNAVIKNVGLRNVNVSGREFVAALVARIDDNTIIESCYATGNVIGWSYVGGLAGYMTGDNSRISDSYSTVILNTTSTSSTHYAGGIVAYRNRGDVIGNYATGGIYPSRASVNVGAVIGLSTGGVGTISGNFWNIESTAMNSGGINTEIMPGNLTVEMIASDTFSSFNFNDVWDIDEGVSYPYLRWEGEERDHNYPTLLPPHYLAAGIGISSILLSWEAPSVGTPVGYNIYREGVKINSITVQQLYFTDENNLEMITYNYTVRSVYDEGLSLPTARVSAKPIVFAGGHGDSTNPYLISTVAQLDGIRYRLDKHYRLIEFIDLGVSPYISGKGWLPIGDNDNPFTGSLNGYGHSIQNIYIYNVNEDYQGLFGVTSGAKITDLALTNVNVTGNNMVGALIGESLNSEITNCYSTGNVSGGDFIGGVIGIIGNGSEVKNCYSMCTITGNEDIGGLIGKNDDSIISFTFSTGTVSGVNRVGGLVGSKVEGDDYEDNSNYWDTETSEILVSAMGSGKSTDELYDENTYQDWDFDDIWIADDSHYPRLYYQILQPPRDLTASSWSNLIILSWSPPIIRDDDELRDRVARSLRNISTDRDGRGDADSRSRELRGYEVYRDDTLINDDALITETRYYDYDVINDNEYSYYLKAVYDEGTSLATESIKATPLLYPVPKPVNLAATTSDNQVRLTWSEPTYASPLLLLGYKIYRDNVLISGENIITSKSFVDYGVNNGEWYSYQVVSVYNLDESDFAGPVKIYVNPASWILPPAYVFTDSMSLSLSAYLDEAEEPTIDSRYWIGVFGPGGLNDCRGIANNNETRYNFSNVYGYDYEEGLPFSFRVYDTVTKNVYGTDAYVEFEPEGVIEDKDIRFFQLYNLTISVQGSGSTIPSRGTRSYPYGEIVTLRATELTGWSFSNWLINNEYEYQEAVIYLEIDSNITATAVFVRNQYTLTINVVGEGITTPGIGNYVYNYGQVIPLTAIPGERHELDRWEMGNAVYHSTTINVSMTTNRTITAYFNPIAVTMITLDRNTFLIEDPEQPYLFNIRASIYPDNAYLQTVAWSILGDNDLGATFEPPLEDPNEIAVSIPVLDETTGVTRIYASADGVWAYCLVVAPNYEGELEDIIEQDILSLDEHPYRVTGDFNLNGGRNTLTIEPGVVIYFEDGYGATIEGTLIANNVTFAGSSEDNRSRWRGLKFIENSGSSELNGMTIINALEPLVIDCDTLNVVNVIIDGGEFVYEDFAVNVSADSAPRLDSLRILGYGRGILFDGDDGEEERPNRLITSTVSNTRIRHSSESVRPETIGIMATGEVNLFLTDVEIDDFSTGISFSSIEVTSPSTITASNIRVRYSSESVRENLVGILIEGDVWVTLEDVYIEDYETGMIITSTYTGENTSVVSNTRVRYASESVREPGLVGIHLKNIPYVSLGTDEDILNEIIGYNKGVHIEADEEVRAITTASVGNLRIRYSSESVRPDAVGLFIEGNVNATIIDIDIEDYDYGIIYTNTLADGTATVSNTRVRYSSESIRDPGIIGMKFSDMNELILGITNEPEIDIVGYNIGIDINSNVNLRDISTVTLSNTRVRFSSESVRDDMYGIYLDGNIEFTAYDVDILDYPIGIYQNNTLPTATTTVGNLRIRYSSESVRDPGLIGAHFINLDGLIINEDEEDFSEIIGYHKGLHIYTADENRDLTTVTVGNLRVRYSSESIRDDSIGLLLEGNIEGTIIDNEFEDYDIGILMAGNVDVTVSNNLFINCLIGILIRGNNGNRNISGPTISYNILEIPSVVLYSEQASAFKADNASAVIHNNTVYKYPAGLISDGVGAEVYFFNNIVWQQIFAQTIILLNGGSADVRYNNISFGYDGEGNIKEDPLFVDADKGNFNLQANSPCINFGDPESDLKEDGSYSDIGAIPYLIPETPVISPERSIIIDEPLQVTITCATEGARIYYTTNGQTPTEESSLYREPLSIDSSTTLKARAFYKGNFQWLPSLIAVGEYYEALPPDNVKAEQEYQDIVLTWDAPYEIDYQPERTLTRRRRIEERQSITKTRSLKGFNIYRREDSDEEFEKINETLIDSTSYRDESLEIGEYEYYVSAFYEEIEQFCDPIVAEVKQLAIPTFSPENVWFSSNIDVTISCADQQDYQDLKIYYTTDGDEPDGTATLFESGIAISENTTIKAKAFQENIISSETASVTYKKLPNPENLNAYIVDEIIVLSWEEPNFEDGEHRSFMPDTRRSRSDNRSSSSDRKDRSLSAQNLSFDNVVPDPELRNSRNIMYDRNSYSQNQRQNPNILGYKVYRNGLLLNIDELISDDYEYYDDTATQGYLYRYTVTAVYQLVGELVDVESVHSQPAFIILLPDDSEGDLMVYDAEHNSYISQLDVNGETVNVELIPSPGTEQTNIAVIYSTNPNILSEEITNPEALGAYFAFIFEDTDIINGNMTFKLQLPLQPNDIWMRYSDDWKNVSEYSVYDDLLPQYTYDLSLVMQSYRSHKIEFAADNGDYFLEPPVVEQVISLNAGWNIISFNVIPENLDMYDPTQPTSIFYNLIDEGNLIKVMNQIGGAIEDLSGAGTGWENNIGDLDWRQGYRVRVTEPTVLSLTGRPVGLPLNVPLLSGWNVVGYPLNDPQNALDMFQPYIDNGMLVKVMDQAGGAIEDLSGVGTDWINSIGSLSPGQGYAVRVTAATDLVYNDLQPGRYAADNRKRDAQMSKNTESMIIAHNYFETVWTGNGWQHFNIYLLTDEILITNLSEGDEIAVFDGEYCVAAAVYQCQEQYISLAASMDEGFELLTNGYTSGNAYTLHLWTKNNDTEHFSVDFEILNGLELFTPGGSAVIKLVEFLSADDEIELTVPQVTDISSIYPNPFNPDSNIRYSIRSAGNVTLEIYNVRGQKIATLAEGYHEAGNYQVTWQGTDSNGINVSSGVYFTRLVTEEKQIIRKMSLIK